MIDKISLVTRQMASSIRGSRFGVVWPLLALAFLASAAKTEPPGKDLQGDPLPEGAVARLGNLRWRHDAIVAFAAFLPDGKNVICVTDDGIVQVWEFPS